MKSAKKEKIYNLTASRRRFAGLKKALSLLHPDGLPEEDLVAALVDSISDPLSILDPELNILWANEPAKKIFGIHIAGKKCYEIYRRRGKPCEPNPCLALKTFQDGEIHEQDSEAIGKKGEILYFHCRANVAIRDRTGSPLAVVKIARDATRLKKAEEKLLESEELYRAFVKNLRGIAFKGTLDFKPIFFHGAVEEITGFTEEEFLAGTLRWNNLIHPRDILKITESMENIRWIPNYSTEREYRILRKDGQTCWIREVIQNIVDDAGNPKHVQGIIYDDSERKQMDNALRESEERFAKAFHSSPAAMAIHTIDNLYVDVNESYLRLCGYSRDELIGRTDSDLSVWANAEERDRVRSRLREQEYFPVAPVHFRTKSGNIVETIFSAERIKIQGKDYILSSCHDVTELREKDEELRKSRDELRNLASANESVREEERSRISQELHDEIGQALTGMKLDLMWLMNRIPGDQKDAVDKAKAAAKCMDDTIDLIRRISSELRPRMLDDLGLAATMEWQLQEFRKRTGIRFEIASELDEGDLDDPVRTALFRIFQEALTNVVRHSAATEVTVELKEAHGEIQMTIRDNGRGISEEEIQGMQSMGILGMRERVDRLGGNLIIIGIPGEATLLRVKIPYQRSDSPEH